MRIAAGFGDSFKDNNSCKTDVMRCISVTQVVVCDVTRPLFPLSRGLTCETIITDSQYFFCS